MLYTKQQLIDAYCASKEVAEVDIPDIIVETQVMLDAKVVRVEERRDSYQNLLDTMVTDAKDYMKVIALKYLARQEAAQSIIDNDAVSL